MDERERAGPGKVLLTGWFSFRDGETTAGDVLALRRVEEVLRGSGTAYDVAWSPGFLTDALHLDDARPGDYTHLVFVCGSLHGPQVEALHRRFAHCVRIAVGTSVVHPADAAATGFHRVLARDAPGSEPSEDLAARAPAVPARPVVGVVLGEGEQEYGEQRRHTQVTELVTRWLAGKDCARLELETRLDTHDWHLNATPAQVQSVLARLDLVVTDRLHGLVLALRVGTPVLAVDPVAGGGRVTAQARACGWPALLSADRLDERGLERWWDWGLTSGRVAARQAREGFRDGRVPDGADRLMEVLTPRATTG